MSAKKSDKRYPTPWSHRPANKHNSSIRYSNIFDANGRFCLVCVKLFYPVTKLVSPNYHGRRSSYIKLRKERAL